MVSASAGPASGSGSQMGNFRRTDWGVNTYRFFAGASLHRSERGHTQWIRQVSCWGGCERRGLYDGRLDAMGVLCPSMQGSARHLSGPNLGRCIRFSQAAYRGSSDSKSRTRWRKIMFGDRAL